MQLHEDPDWKPGFTEVNNTNLLIRNWIPVGHTIKLKTQLPQSHVTRVQ
jgi:hypothetical protein